MHYHLQLQRGCGHPVPRERQRGREDQSCGEDSVCSAPHEVPPRHPTPRDPGIQLHRHLPHHPMASQTGQLVTTIYLSTLKSFRCR